MRPISSNELPNCVPGATCARGSRPSGSLTSCNTGPMRASSSVTADPSRFVIWCTASSIEAISRVGGVGGSRSVCPTNLSCEGVAFIGRGSSLSPAAFDRGQVELLANYPDTFPGHGELFGNSDVALAPIHLGWVKLPAIGLREFPSVHGLITELDDVVAHGLVILLEPARGLLERQPLRQGFDQHCPLIFSHALIVTETGSIVNTCF